jgi:hypothetical protein
MRRPGCGPRAKEAFRVISNHVGDLDVHSDLTITKDVTGSIAVRAGGMLVLLGTAHGGVTVSGGGFARIAGTTNGLFVCAGGHAVLVGTCRGSAINDGGELTIEGVVTETVVEHAGTTKLGQNAVIHKGLIRASGSLPGARGRGREDSVGVQQGLQ